MNNPAGSLWLAALGLLGGHMFAAGPGSRNVLLIISDDLNTMLGCYGDSIARTPNIDRLAARGTRFDRAYCTFPLCGPSRTSMLTGLYPNSTGILRNPQIFRQTIPSQISLPQAFRHQGYFAARAGKLYHYAVPEAVGTSGHDDPASWELDLNPAGVDWLEERDRIAGLVEFGGSLSWYASAKSDDEHTDGMLAAGAERILEWGAKGSRPFFLAVGFFRPHTPFVAPKRYFEPYPEKDMRVVQHVAEDQADIPAPAISSKKRTQAMLTDELRRKALQAYYASISFMDAQVGRVLAALDRLELAENTVIVFTSDHGYHTGEHGLWMKMSLFEESARVPLLIVAPGVSRKGAVVSTPVSLIDLYPTLTELCNVEAPGNLQGQSLMPMLKEPEMKGRGWALTQVRRDGQGADFFLGYSLRTARWRYTEWDEGKQGRELYDHDADPRELTNLAADPAHAAIVEKLSQRLHAVVSGTFPRSGEMPPIKDGLWFPLLVAP